MNPTNFADLINRITPEMHSGLRRAVELGRMPDGSRIDREQQAELLQVLLAWEKKNLPEDEQSGAIIRHKQDPNDREQAVTLRPHVKKH